MMAYPVPIREAAMRGEALAREITVDRVDLEALDKFLMSNRSPPDSMVLSELDGFLTGLAIGPTLVRPSEWLPLIWGGDAPEFTDLDEANAIFANIMARYNDIIADIANDALAPIFWADRNGTFIAVDWAEGFLQAIKLRADAWKPLFTSKRDGKLLLPILLLCGDHDGNSLLGLAPEAEDHIADRVTELIPGCVIGIAAYWRRKGSKQLPISLRAGPRPASSCVTTKIGRNDPCPCSSGRKFKRCCGPVR
jgi:uncharacterized protein